MPDYPLQLSRQGIERLIPHRPPFLWIDEVTELTPSRIVAVKRLPPDLDVFTGHYPAYPVLPGVLQCEAAFQAGAVLIARQLEERADAIPVVTRLSNVQFRRMVRPGEILTLQVELTERVANAYYLKGKVLVDGQVSVRLEFACTLTSPAQ